MRKQQNVCVWEGLIIDTPQGLGGFGYDPYFWLPEMGVTVAQLAPKDKNRLSHRGMAMRVLRDQLAASERLEPNRLAHDRPVRT